MRPTVLVCALAVIPACARHAPRALPPAFEDEPPSGLKPGEECRTTTSLPDWVPQEMKPLRRVVIDTDSDGRPELVDNVYGTGEFRLVRWLDANHDGCLDTRTTVFTLTGLQERHILEHFKGTQWTTVREWIEPVIAH